MQDGVRKKKKTKPVRGWIPLRDPFEILGIDKVHELFTKTEVFREINHLHVDEFVPAPNPVPQTRPPDP